VKVAETTGTAGIPGGTVDNRSAADWVAARMFGVCRAEEPQILHHPQAIE
jgi:hypothetical protein